MRYILVVLMLVLGAPATAQDSDITLVSDVTLEESGFWSYVLPRFKLKTRIAVGLEYGDTGGDVLVSQGDNPFMEGQGARYSVTVINPSAQAEKLVDWLTSEVGGRTITAFKIDGMQVFSLVTEIEVVEVVVLTGNTNVGEEVAYRKCGRCHVIGERNKYGGIDSTPSFGALRSFPDWQVKFGTFWTLNPHPSFTQVEDITPPFDPARPPSIYPIYLTVDEVADIGAYVQGMTPKDLGPKLEGE